MGELILVRHGQARFQSDDYDRLSPLGAQQARWLGAYFSAHAIAFEQRLSGSLRRHRETAQGIAQGLGGGMTFREDPRFDEFDAEPLVNEYVAATGVDHPTDRASFLAHFPPLFEGWEEGRYSGSGETYRAFQTRVDAAIDTALSHPGRSLIVTSGGVIAATIRRVLGLSNAATADILLDIHNASMHRIVNEGGRLRLSLYNASPHLDPRDRAHARTYV
ncbi:MAG: histidine phosphatase family protein [Pseudomonadota bacterium]